MKLQEIFQINNRCKLCDSKTIVYMRKYIDYITDTYNPFKSMARGGIKRKISLINNEQILIQEKGPFKYLISEGLIDLKNDKFSLKAIEGYDQPRITLSVKFSCPIEMRYLAADDEDDVIHGARYMKAKDASDDDYELEENYDFNRVSDRNNHFTSQYYIHIDQEKQQIDNIIHLHEKLEDDSFIIHKDFINNTTKIIKKEKSLNLSFILNKKFNDEEFTKLVEAAGLLR